MIERLSNSVSTALVGSKFSPIPPKTHFTREKKSVTTAQNYKVNITRMVALFHKASLTRPAATAIDLETPCVCARLHCSVLTCPTSRSSARPAARALPQELCQSKPSNVFWNSFRKSFPGDRQGLEFELKLATTNF